MSTLKICRICLRTEAKGYKFERYQLKYFYEEVTALKVLDNDELPQWFCYECATMLYKFHKFKEKCFIGQKYLKELLWKGPITYEAIYKLIKSTNLHSTLSTITVTDKVKVFTIKEAVTNNCEVASYKNSEHQIVANKKKNRRHSKLNFDKVTYDLDTEKHKQADTVSNLKTEDLINLDTKFRTNLQENVNNLDIKEIDNSGAEKEHITDLNVDDFTRSNTNNLYYSDNTLDTNKISNLDDFENLNTETGNPTSSDKVSNTYEDKSDDISGDQSSPISILVQDDKVVNLKTENLRTNKNKNIEISNFKEFGRLLSEENWKKKTLSEEEALGEFRKKAEDPKYLDAAYKCTDCFKGFSKKDMLIRHVQSRHSEDLGSHECRFCRMRFKFQCHLRKHIQQHYTEYECLRCHVVFHLDTSAALHEEYHSGATKKCSYCDEEFRHVTTYYTHMRTHRSAHVCVRCGASFVSGAGLRQHSRRKHPEDGLESPSSESEGEGRESYCARCDLRFHSRRAHTEHLFHSDMHTEVITKPEDTSPAKKIMGKRLREKITKELRKRKSDQDPITPVKSKRRKRVKRKHKKPSTCYQCGERFPTQAACMKHHVTAHPRTSFHSARHICEVCGASLAPGSVAVHQNMHSRERVHPCGACGRQFHSAVGLKRHLVTHTGEKPFACPLCEKRFTQSNSMKLHYRTFHLKQPYPKRTRKKKKDEPHQSTEQDDTYEESDSVPEATSEVPAPPEMPAQLEVPTVLHIENTGLDQENMHYLTLG